MLYFPHFIPFFVHSARMIVTPQYHKIRQLIEGEWVGLLLTPS